MSPIVTCLAPLLFCAGCAFVDNGPDEVELISDPPGATIELRAPGQLRVLPGVTPMTVQLLRSLPDPIEIEFRLNGYEPFVRRLRKTRDHGFEVLEREDWRWPSDPIRVRLLERAPRR